MQLIPGKEISIRILSEINPPKNRKLAIILANDDVASDMFVKLKSKRALEVGIDTELHKLPSSVSLQELEGLIMRLNADEEVGGILLQLPIYSSLSEHETYLVNIIEEGKDVDGITASMQGKASQGLPGGVNTASVDSCLECLRYVAEGEGKDLGSYLRGKRVLVINHSDLIGKPLAAQMANWNATVTIANEFTKDISSLTKSSNIIISATGGKLAFNESMFSEGTVFLDVSSFKDENNNVRGDLVLNAAVEGKISWLAPSPGGVGPVTIACLLRNFQKLNELQG